MDYSDSDVDNELENNAQNLAYSAENNRKF